MKVLVCKRNGWKLDLEVMEIEDELQTYYDLIECDTITIVGGNVDGKRFDIVADDNGLLVEHPILTVVHKDNLDGMYVGNLVFTGLGDENGELTSLDDEIIEAIKARKKTVFTTAFQPLEVLLFDN